MNTFYIEYFRQIGEPGILKEEQMIQNYLVKKG